VFRKIGGQLTSSFLLVILFSMGVLGFFILKSWENYAMKDLDHQLHLQAQTVASMWGRLEREEKDRARQERLTAEFVRRFSEHYGSRIQILDRSRNILLDTGSTEVVLWSLKEIDQALDGREASKVIDAPPSGSTQIYFLAYPIKVNTLYEGKTFRAIPGVVCIARSLTYIRTIKGELQRLMLMGILLSLIISGVLSLVLSHYLSSPIQVLSKAAEQIASGDLSMKVPVLARNEIGELASRFNYMASHLRSKNEELMEEKNKLSAIMTNMADGVLLLDEEGKVLIRNDAAMELLGLGQSGELERIPCLDAIVHEALKSSDEGRAELDGVPGGKVLNVAFTPLRTERGELVGIVLILHDITQCKRLDQMKTEFITNLSHELKTPLASIKGLAELLKDGAMHEAEGMRILDSIEREVERLTRLVKDLLDLSKIEVGLVKMEYVSFNPADLIEEVLIKLKGKLQSGRVAIARELSSSSLVYGDPDRIEQVLMNLLDNATRYAPDGSVITVGLYEKGDSMAVFVADQGPGLLEEDLPRVFDRFFRGAKPRTRDNTETGLGLSIARQIVENQGGRIWVENTSPGSRFTFTIPITERMAERTA